jgi:hypothetical protein
MLADHERVFPDFTPPFSVVHRNYIRTKKCWHGKDKRRRHAENGLIVTISSEEVDLSLPATTPRTSSLLSAVGFPVSTTTETGVFQFPEWRSEPNNGLPV